MNNEINEIILRSRRNKEPMSFERYKFTLNFIAGMVAMIMGFALAYEIVYFMGT